MRDPRLPFVVVTTAHDRLVAYAIDPATTLSASPTLLGTLPYRLDEEPAWSTATALRYTTTMAVEDPPSRLIKAIGDLAVVVDRDDLLPTEVVEAFGWDPTGGDNDPRYPFRFSQISNAERALYHSLNNQHSPEHAAVVARYRATGQLPTEGDT